MCCKFRDPECLPSQAPVPSPAMPCFLLGAAMHVCLTAGSDCVVVGWHYALSSLSLFFW